MQFNDVQFNATMPSIRPPRLARPCVLSRIKPSSVRLLFEPYVNYFAARGTPLDAIGTNPEALHAVMLTATSPCESTPAEMVDRLELLELLCDPGSGASFEDGYEDLVSRIREPDDGPEDIAVRIIVNAPQIAWREFDRLALSARRTFRSYSVPPGTAIAPPVPSRLASLERVMSPWFERNGRSGVCHVTVRKESCGTSFIIRHGGLLRRLNVISETGNAVSHILRPERVDVAHYRPETGEWLISGTGRRLQDMYREAFGLTFHRSECALAIVQRYSLEPLRFGISSLRCRIGDNIQSAVLSYLKIESPSGVEMTFKRPCIFAELRSCNPAYLSASKLLEARVDLTIALQRRALPVILRPNGTRSTGATHDELVTRWLDQRGFIANFREARTLQIA